MAIMKTLYNTLIEYREEGTNRIPIQIFMCLPSRRDFPEYFNMISKPIAMNKIRERIERHYYPDVNSCLDDFKLMFSNCRFFNEEDSLIYRDAWHLEDMVVKTSRRELSATNGNQQQANKIANNNSVQTNHLTTTSTPGKKTVSPQKSNIVLVNSNGNSNSNSNNNNSNGVDISNDDTSTMQSDSTSHSKTTQQNGKDDADSSIRINHDHHNETSMDSSSNLSADILASTPVEKCSLNTRRGRNPEAPKRQLLTGYIIYASEIRKEVIDKNPNQNFGDISRLVGNEWKALPHDIRSKYDQRALIHNKRVRERAQRELHAPTSTPDGQHLPNGSSTPKLTKRKLAKLAKEQMRQHHLSIARNDDSMSQTPKPGHDYSSANASQSSNSAYKHPHQQQLATQLSAQSSSGKTTTTESSTQTTAIRFVEPPTKKRLVYSESFRKYIEGLQVPNRDLLVEETAPERPPELPTHWLGAGIGRHESPEAALWALRDFMLQDAVTMRRNMEPYL